MELIKMKDKTAVFLTGIDVKKIIEDHLVSKGYKLVDDINFAVEKNGLRGVYTMIKGEVDAS